MHEDKAELEEQLCHKGEQIQEDKPDVEHLLRQKEEQIQAKDREKAELEEQLHQKEEQIQTKDRENAELKQQLHQKEKQIRAKDKHKEELEQQLHQREEHIIYLQQGSAGAQSQHKSTYFLSSPEETKTSTSDLNDIASISQIQVVEMECKSDDVQVIPPQEEGFRSRDKEFGQVMVKQGTIQIDSHTEITVNESRHHHNRIEMLTNEKQELTRKMDAVVKEAETVHDVCSQEVDQLRDE